MPDLHQLPEAIMKKVEVPYTSRFIDFTGWREFVKRRKPEDRLYLMDLPLKQTYGRTPDRVMFDAVKWVLEADRPTEANWDPCGYHNLMKLMWLAEEYVKGGYQFNFPVGAIYTDGAYVVHPGHDRVNLLRMMNVETAPCIYFDNGGTNPPPGPAEEIPDMEFLFDRYPKATWLTMTLFEFRDGLIPSFIFNLKSLDAGIGYGDAYDLVRSVPYIPVKLRSSNASEIRTSFTYDVCLLGAGLPVKEIEDTSSVPYYVEVRKPMKRGHTFLETLLWVNPGYAQLIGQGFTVHIRDPKTTETLWLPKAH